MDETLLSINLNAFILRYFKDVSSMLADIGRRSRGGTMARLGTILVDLNANRRSGTDNRTNLEFYRTEVERRCGICLSDPIIYEAFTYYDREVLPHKNDDVINAHAMPGAHAALQAVQDAGLRCALFTNPSFPQGAIECRMGWGDLADAPFELVTHMGNTTRCKPDATYYLEQLQVMGLEPHEVLMVGNDPKRDFPSPACGIQTAYVGQGKPGRATWHGTMEDFAREFNAVVEAFYEHQVADELSSGIVVGAVLKRLVKQERPQRLHSNADVLATTAKTRQSEQGALKRGGIDLLVMPPKLKGRLPLWRVCSVD